MLIRNNFSILVGVERHGRKSEPQRPADWPHTRIFPRHLETWIDRNTANYSEIFLTAIPFRDLYLFIKILFSLLL